MININEQLKRIKIASRNLIKLSDDIRNKVLKILAQELLINTAIILEENNKDLKKIPATDQRYDRLQLTEKRIKDLANDVLKVASLPSPLERNILTKILPNGLHLQKISVPLGVVAVIYESRPNVTIDVFTLCFKSGNACILKGGKEAEYTNNALLAIINKALIAENIHDEVIYLLPKEKARELTDCLLTAVGLIDVCIPRGGQQLINYVRSHAKIPIIETGAGIVHTYFDLSGDLTKGQKIITNAKTRRVSVCNALDTLIIHQQRLNDLPELISPLAIKNVEIFADQQSYQILQNKYPTALLKLASVTDFGKEFLALKMAIKTVATLEEAIAHIMQYTSGHSEAIIAEDQKTIDYFLRNVDAAAVYANASTAFTDGGEFGMGAEIGISTQKLHARGPMGLEELTSYKWLIRGNGQVRNP